METPVRFELTTFGFVDQRSNSAELRGHGKEDGIRTRDIYHLERVTA